MQHRGVVLAAELTANLRKRGGGELLDDVHRHLARESNRARVAANFQVLFAQVEVLAHAFLDQVDGDALLDRKSTRLNSSNSQISYAVFCLKKKKIENDT